MSDRIPMTRAGYDKLKADFEQLNAVELPKSLSGWRSRVPKAT